VSRLGIPQLSIRLSLDFSRQQSLSMPTRTTKVTMLLHFSSVSRLVHSYVCVAHKYGVKTSVELCIKTGESELGTAKRQAVALPSTHSMCATQLFNIHVLKNTGGFLLLRFCYILLSNSAWYNNGHNYKGWTVQVTSPGCSLSLPLC